MWCSCISIDICLQQYSILEFNVLHWAIRWAIQVIPSISKFKYLEFKLVQLLLLPSHHQSLTVEVTILHFLHALTQYSHLDQQLSKQIWHAFTLWLLQLPKSYYRSQILFPLESQLMQSILVLSQTQRVALPMQTSKLNLQVDGQQVMPQSTKGTCQQLCLHKYLSQQLLHKQGLQIHTHLHLK
jgi:hypothetical protein